MGRKKSAKWPLAVSGTGAGGDVSDSGPPANKTAAARKVISENSPDMPYAEIVAGVKEQYGYDLKNGDISNAKSYLRKASGKKALRKVKGKKRGMAAKSAAPAVKAAAATDTVSATLDLVAAVGLEQARAIIAGLK